MIRNDLENPMVVNVDAAWNDANAEAKPDIVCPTCGTGWYLHEDGACDAGAGAFYDGEPVSASGRFCPACVKRKCDSDARLLQWYDERCDASELLEYLLDEERIAPSDAADELVDWLRSCSKRRFTNAVRDFMADDESDRESVYVSWLMENC